MDDSERAASMTDVDVDWAAVDPAAASSLRMALVLGRALENAGAVEARCGAATDAYLSQHAADAAADGQGDESRLGSFQPSAALDGACDEADEADGAAEAGGDDDAGMDAPANSMASMGMGEATDSDDVTSWHLVRISKRRRRKFVGVAESDLDGAYTDDDLRFEYLCAWRHKRDDASTPPTMSWELRGWLLDAGFTEQVTDCDEARLPPRHYGGLDTRGPKLSSVMDLARALASASYSSAAHSGLLALMASRNQFARWDAEARARVQASLSGSLSRLPQQEAMWLAGLAQRLLENAHFKGYKIVGSTFITPGTLDTFVGTAPGTHTKSKTRVSLLFHGTSSDCAKSIARQGLLVPGDRGVNVRHGTAYGVGIYAAHDMDFAYSFASDAGTMLVCCGCGAPSASTGSFFVYGFSNQIVPFIRINVTRRW
jgi:hypothetical protein